ncbi:MAG: hypothetical protein J5924_06695 [Bacteroidaceae bacterium]|nr:hypothetical protein [Bacteroidaceae bacterium]
MKRKIVFVATLMLSTIAWAEDFNLYYTATSDGTNVKVESVKSLQKVVFENGNMVITFKDGSSKTVALSLVQRLRFFTDSGIVGVEDVKNAEACMKHQVHDLTGRKLGDNINIKQLSKGTYIIDGQKTFIK